jgi:hypothetical protein
MISKLLRLAYVGEFLLAIVAVYTAWSEIAGQAPLDLMHWGWKMGLGVALSLAIVGFSQAVVSEDAFWTLRSARWLGVIIALILGMGALTFFYALQEDTDETDDTSTISYVEKPSEHLLRGLIRVS